MFRRVHLKDHRIQILTNASDVGYGAHVDQDSAKGLWSDREKKTTHKYTRTEGNVFGPETVQNPVSKSDSIDSHRQFNSGSLKNKQGGTHSMEMCTFLWRIMTCCHDYKILLHARHIPGCL